MSIEKTPDAGKGPYREQGAAICGEKIIAEARKVIKKPPRKGSSSHRIQRRDLEGDVYCVISKAFRIRPSE